MDPSATAHDDAPGMTKGGVAAAPPMPQVSTPTVGNDPMLTHPHIEVDGAFAIGDSGVG